jgi:hypothetical protein
LPPASSPSSPTSPSARQDKSSSSTTTTPSAPSPADSAPTRSSTCTPTAACSTPPAAVIPAVNLAADGTIPLATVGLPEPTRRRLARLAEMLVALPDETSISITAPENLVRELFTHKGHGTLVQRGEAILIARDFDGIDRDRLRALISSCFGRALADDYFERKRCQRVYVTESYRAAAVITEEAGIAYLDKLAVTSKARGEGLAAKLWARMRADFPRLFWRARDDNPVRSWYFDRADGGMRRGRWVVFWYGIEDFDEIRTCIDTACALEETLAPRTER